MCFLLCLAGNLARERRREDDGSALTRGSSLNVSNVDQSLSWEQTAREHSRMMEQLSVAKTQKAA